MMEIKPCRKELRSITLQLFLLYMVLVLLGICSLIFEEDRFVTIFAMILVTMGWGIFYIGLFLYFGRTFILDENSLTMVLGKYQRTYEWEELYVQYYEYSPDKYDVSPVFPGSGIFISVYPVKSLKKGPLNYCLSHSMSSVFFRFTLKDTNDENTRPANTVGAMFYGYMVEKEPLLKIISHANVITQNDDKKK